MESICKIHGMTLTFPERNMCQICLWQFLTQDHMKASINQNVDSYLCDKHYPHPYTLFCITEEKPICELCIANHNGHNLQAIEILRDEHIEDVKNLSSENAGFNVGIARCNDMAKEVEKAQEGVERYADEAVSGIEETLNQLVDAVDKLRVGLKKKIDENKNGISSDLVKKQESIQNLKTRFEGNQSELLEYIKKMQASHKLDVVKARIEKKKDFDNHLSSLDYEYEKIEEQYRQYIKTANQISYSFSQVIQNFERFKNKSFKLEQNTLLNIQTSEKEVTRGGRTHPLRRGESDMFSSIVVESTNSGIDSFYKNQSSLIVHLPWNKDFREDFDLSLEQVRKRKSLNIQFKIPNYSRVVVTFSERIFLVGGSIGQSGYATNNCFELVDNALVKRGRMISNRADFGIVAIHNNIFVAGGVDLGTLTSECEKFDIIANEWSSIAPLKEEKCALTLCAMTENIIYAIGGANQMSQITQTLERYTISEDIWEMMTFKLPDFYSLRGAIAINDDEILIFGGHDKNGSETNACYKLVEKTGEFIKQTPLLMNSSFVHGAYIHNDKVYALGREGHVFKYKTEKNEWSVVQSNYNLSSEEEVLSENEGFY